MFDWITGLVQQMGYVGVALLMFLENVFPPIPSELIMPLAGFVAERGELDFWGVVLAGTIGSLAGAVGWYLVGRWIGEPRLRGWVQRHGKWLTVAEDDLDRAEAWFEEHGSAAIFVGRLVPAVRTLISLPAGFVRMGLGRFLLLSTAGTFVWTLALAWAGRLLGESYGDVQQWLDPVTWVIVGGLVALYVYRLVRQLREERPA